MSIEEKANWKSKKKNVKIVTICQSQLFKFCSKEHLNCKTFLNKNKEHLNILCFEFVSVICSIANFNFQKLDRNTAIAEISFLITF